MKTIDTKHGRIISHVDLSDEAIEAIDRLMESATETQRRSMIALNLIPVGCTHQTYGSGGCVVVREPRPEVRDEE